MAAPAAKARPAVLRHAGAVLAVTAGFDPSAPNMARVYGHWLGGKDAFPADRGEADRLLAIYPPLRDMVRENRAFIAEAAAWAAGQGISQFIDLGAGLPVRPSVHQAVRAVMPTARVAYVDIDPVVLSHARALLVTNDGVTAVAADLGSPDAVLTDPELRAVIDPTWPVCVILGAVLHFIHAEAAREVTAGYARLLVADSCLVISVAHLDDERISKELAEEYTAAEWHNHSRADIASFFGGLDMVGPGIGEAQTWRSWQTTPVWRRRDGHVLAGVGRVPRAWDWGRQPVRYSDMARVDLDATGQKVRDWLLAHPSGTPEQMAGDLKGKYEEHAEAMAIVLRGIMARYTNNPEELADLQAHAQLDRPGHLRR